MKSQLIATIHPTYTFNQAFVHVNGINDEHVQKIINLPGSGTFHIDNVDIQVDVTDDYDDDCHLSLVDRPDERRSYIMYGRCGALIWDEDDWRYRLRSDVEYLFDCYLESHGMERMWGKISGTMDEDYLDSCSDQEDIPIYDRCTTQVAFVKTTMGSTRVMIYDDGIDMDPDNVGFFMSHLYPEYLKRIEKGE